MISIKNLTKEFSGQKVLDGIDIDIEKLTIQKEELTEVKWFSMQELQDMVDKKILNLDQIACFTKCVDYLHNKK